MQPSSSGTSGWDENAVVAYTAFLLKKKKIRQLQQKPLPPPPATTSKDQSDDDDMDDDNSSRRFPEILLVDERLRVMRSTYLRYLRHQHGQLTGVGDEKPTTGSSGSGNSSSSNSSQISTAVMTASIDNDQNHTDEQQTVLATTGGKKRRVQTTKGQGSDQGPGQGSEGEGGDDCHAMVSTPLSCSLGPRPHGYFPPLDIKQRVVSLTY